MKRIVFFIFALVLLFACDRSKEPAPILVTKITLNTTETTILIGESEQLSVNELRPLEATEKGITWSSDNTALATVDETGVVLVPETATEGTVTITATAKDGSDITATCIVTVVSVLKIGQACQGGIIAYIDETGKHGLIAAATSINKGMYGLIWGGRGIETKATGTEIGTGKSNTKKIVQAIGAGNYPAKLCDDLVLNGYDDWFLPSRDELHVLFKNEILTEFDYWSSTEHNALNAWSQARPLETPNKGLVLDKGYTLMVRAVRYF